MDLVSQQATGKVIQIGLRWIEQEKKYDWVPDAATVDGNKPLALARKVFEPDFKTIHGIVYGTKVRRIPTVPYAVWGIFPLAD